MRRRHGPEAVDQSLAGNASWRTYGDDDLRNLSAIQPRQEGVDQSLRGIQRHVAFSKVEERDSLTRTDDPVRHGNDCIAGGETGTEAVVSMSLSDGRQSGLR